MTPNDYVASQIRRIRKQRGWTQAETAKRCGVSLSYYQRRESAYYHMNIEDLSLFQTVLGFSIKEVWPVPQSAVEPPKSD